VTERKKSVSGANSYFSHKYKNDKHSEFHSKSIAESGSVSDPDSLNPDPNPDPDPANFVNPDSYPDPGLKKLFTNKVLKIELKWTFFN